MKYQMPEPDIAEVPTCSPEGYTATQMQAAFDAGRVAGLEAAAKVCDSLGDEHTWHISAAIRNLAKETP